MPTATATTTELSSVMRESTLSVSLSVYGGYIYTDSKKGPITEVSYVLSLSFLRAIFFFENTARGRVKNFVY